MQYIRKENLILAKKMIMLLSLLLIVNIAHAENPIIKHIRCADPDAHVWKDGKVWIYASHDQDSATNYSSMDGYHCYSSSDMVNWTDHGEILHSRNVKWAVGGTMYAPCAAYKNNKYYLYFPTICNKGEWSWRIGVAVSDKPEGPFTEIGNYIKGTDNIDPCCFIDDDGTAYLYWGGEDHGDAIPRVAKLKENMIELAETPRIVDYGRYDVQTGAEKLAKNQKFGEGSYMHKRNGNYYFSYNGSGGKYAMGKSPYGPFEYKGVVNSNNNTGAQDHHSMLEYQGKWYFFYHVGNFNNGTQYAPSMYRRNVCIDYLYYNTDGTMKEVVLTKTGVKKVTTGISVNGSETADSRGILLTPENVRSDGSIIRISIYKTERGPVDLTLYDVNGKMLRTLTSGVRERGENVIEYSTGEFPYGKYLVKLNNGDGVVAVLITIIR